MPKVLIQNANIVNEGSIFKGSILIEDELIVRIFRSGEDIERKSDIIVIDGENRFLLPGIIDDQVHFREPGLTHKGDIFTETRAAVAGGITSFMEMPNTVPQTSTNDLIKQKQEIASKKSVTNYSFYLGATNENIEEIKMVDPKTVCGIKVFMGGASGRMLVDNIESLRKIFEFSPILVACHCEDEPIINENLNTYLENFGENIPIEYHPRIRSREACYKSSSLASRLAMEYGTRLHILHLSTSNEMELFDNTIPLSEKKITSEVCVHHLWFDESDYATKGKYIKWNPAIKLGSDREALLESVNNDRIDIIATDHAPHTKEEKAKSYTGAPSGGPLVQHSLIAMMELWHMGKISIEKIVDKMCHSPAVLFDISNRGYIREGYKADLCLVNPSASWEVAEDNILYKCGWSPFTGQEFRSKVEKTFVNGQLVWDNGKINDNVNGQLLKFNR